MNSIGNLISDLLQLGLPIDFYSTYVSQVQALTVTNIEQAAQGLLNPTQMIWMVVADRVAVEAELRALQIGEIVILEA